MFQCLSIPKKSTQDLANLETLFGYLTPKVPWLCFSKNTEKLPPWRPEKGHAKKNLFLEIQL
jgi:hypothetical protein